MKHLPDELWVLIIDHLEIPIDEISIASGCRMLNKTVRERYSTLSSLCLTSSRFQRLAQPVIYRTLLATTRKVQLPLLATLHQHPRLAQYVKALNLGEGITTRSELVTLLIPYYFPSQAEPWSRSELLQEEFQGIFNSQSTGYFDIWFAHWVLLLPNLRILEYATPRFSTALPTLIQRAAQQEPDSALIGDQSARAETPEAFPAVQHQQGSPSTTPTTALTYTPLAKLEEFRILHHYEEMAIDLRHYQEVFLLPHLRIFHGSMVDLNTTLARGVPRSKQPPHQSTLRHAYLEESLADADDLEDMLRTCPSLQTLRMDWGPEPVGESHVDFDRISTVLCEYGASLEVLDLSCQEAFEYVANEFMGYLGSLRGLERLKHLSVQQNMLLPSNVRKETDGHTVAPNGLESLLPDGLESLDLYSLGCGKMSVVVGVQGVLSSRRLVRLKKVQVRHESRHFLEWDLGGWTRKMHSYFLAFDR